MLATVVRIRSNQAGLSVITKRSAISRLAKTRGPMATLTNQAARAVRFDRGRRARTCFERAKQDVPHRLAQRVFDPRKLVRDQSALKRPDRTVSSSDRVELHCPNLTTPDEVIELAGKIPDILSKRAFSTVVCKLSLLSCTRSHPNRAPFASGARDGTMWHYIGSQHSEGG